MKRIFDIVMAFTLLFLFLIPMIIIAMAVFVTSKGSFIFFSRRVGRNGIIFQMPKFRSMHIKSPEIATHKLKNPDQFITPIGRIIRKYSLDELPQLYSVLKGDMSFVGPRPALFNQKDLIALRDKKGINKLLPGITGWAQINGRDELSTPDKVELDLEYLNRQSFLFDLKILWITILKVVGKSGVSH